MFFPRQTLDENRPSLHNVTVITQILTACVRIRSFKVPCGRKRKKHKIATHKRKKQLRKNRHKKK